MLKDNRGAKDERSHCLLPQLIKLVSLTKEAWVGLDRANQVNNDSLALLDTHGLCNKSMKIKFLFWDGRQQLRLNRPHNRMH